MLCALFFVIRLSYFKYCFKLCALRFKLKFALIQSVIFEIFKGCQQILLEI